MDTPQIYDRVRPRKFAPPIIRPSESTIRAKRREISVRYRASGYKPTITDLRGAELTRLLIDRRISGQELLSQICQLIDKPRKLKATTIGRIIRLSNEERITLNIRTIRPYDLSTADLLADTIAQRRYRQRLYAEKKRRTLGAIPRKTYQEASLSQQRPWEAMGICRRTWERSRANGKLPHVASPSTHTLTCLSVDGLATLDCCPV